MREKDDWRLTNQQNYLRGVHLRWKEYSGRGGTWDHDHCEFCWAKFMDEDHPDIQRAGYSTADGYRWICKQCFEDFKDLFDWTVNKNP